MTSGKDTSAKTTLLHNHPWVKEFPGLITVCDDNGIIIDMNDAAAESFSDRGGLELLGSQILDCHPEPSKSKFSELIRSRKQNIYTIQKAGRRKLVFQTPWFLDGKYAGYLDMTLDIPWELPHFNCDSGKPGASCEDPTKKEEA